MAERKEGYWIAYHENGKLMYKGDYKNGKREGSWISYWGNGQLSSKGNYKNDKKEGYWIGYYSIGTINKRETGTYKNGKMISD